MSVITIDLSDGSDDLEDLPDIYLPTKSSTSSQTLNELSPSNSKTLSQQTGSVSSQTLDDSSPSTSKNCSQSSQKSDNIVKRSDKKEQKRREVEERQAARQAQKIYKPGECMKYMTVEMHPSLLEAWYCADVGREVGAGGARVTANAALCDVRLVLWSRLVQPSFTCNNGVVGLTPTKERCTHGLYVASLDDMAQHVARQTLSRHMAQAARLAGCKLTLVLYAVKDFFKTSKRPANKTRVIEQIDLEMALTDLLVSANCDTISVNTPNELALTVAQFTKALAEAPYKQAKRAYDEQADFYMRGDNKKCVAISKNGDGVGMVWQQMIAMLPKSSLETARAICGKYKTPKMLYQSLQEPNSISSIADLGVSRSAVPGSKARRVGNEFARKLHILFTAEDGNTLVE